MLIGFCDPIGEKSLWSSFDMELNSDKPIIMVASKIDSNSLFRDKSFGYSQRLANIVVLGLIHAMSKGQSRNLPKNVVFSMFGAESFGFAGSQRFADDLSAFTCEMSDLHDNCPLNRGGGCSSPCHRDLNFTKLNFDLIESIIEYDSVGHLYDAGDYYLHADDPSISATLLTEFGQNFTTPAFNQSLQRDLSVTAAGEGNKLPPSSAMAFLKKKRGIPTIVVSDYKSEFNNKYI